jgi:hypothetical protein
MILVIKTQYMENYGAHDWDGEGVCPQYWKYKGGSEYKVRNIPLDCVIDDYPKIVGLVSKAVSRSDDYCREYVIEWTMESDDYKSWFEKSQLEHDGSITYGEPEIDYGSLTSTL